MMRTRLTEARPCSGVLGRHLAFSAAKALVAHCLPPFGLLSRPRKVREERGEQSSSIEQRRGLMKVKIVSWNVAGLLSMEPWVTYHFGGLKGLFDSFSADIVALQETKVTPERTTPKQAEYLHVEGWDSYHAIGAFGGYCGVATYVKRGALSPRGAYTNVRHWLGGGEEETNKEGRLVVTDHGAFVLLNVYVPNAGDPPERPRLPVKLLFLQALYEKMEELREDGRAVILAGDLNIVSDPQADSHPGLKCVWSSAELDFFARLRVHYVDSFRHLHPDKTDAYTCWDQVKDNRGRNWGTRIDYICISRDKLLPHLHGASVLETPTRMSDHAAVEVTLDDVIIAIADTDEGGQQEPPSSKKKLLATGGGGGYMAEVSGARLFKRAVPESQKTLKSFFAKKAATTTPPPPPPSTATLIPSWPHDADDEGTSKRRGDKRPRDEEEEQAGSSSSSPPPPSSSSSALVQETQPADKLPPPTAPQSSSSGPATEDCKPPSSSIRPTSKQQQQPPPSSQAARAVSTSKAKQHKGSPSSKKKGSGGQSASSPSGLDKYFTKAPPPPPTDDNDEGP